MIKKYNSDKMVEFVCSVDRADGGVSSKFETKKKVHVVDLSLDVEVGDVLTVFVPKAKNDKGEWVVEQIWAGFLLSVRYEDAEVKQYLIDELERIGDEGIRELGDSVE